MRRGALSAVLVAACLGLGLATLMVCSENRARAARLDALHRTCQDLELRNAHSRAEALGHRPGELELDDVEVSH